MAQLPIQFIYFALALMLSHGDVSRISITQDSKLVIAWNKQSDVQWLTAESAGAGATEWGIWSFNKEKMEVLALPPAGSPSAAAKAVDVSKFLKLDPEKGEPSTIEIAGQAFVVARNGNDVVLTPKGDGPHNITIHYEAAAAAKPVSAPSPKGADSEKTPAVPSVAGKYAGAENKESLLDVNEDATFVMHESGSEVSGTYKVDGAMMTLSVGGGEKTMKVKIEGDALVPVTRGQKMIRQP